MALLARPLRNRGLVNRTKTNKTAFTLVEIMIVVALIGVLVTLALPAMIKSRKQSQGRRIINDARQLDAAISSWVMENGKKDGDPVDTVEASTYLKTTWNAADVLGNGYVIGSVGTNQLQISPATKTALANVGIDWGAY